MVHSNSFSFLLALSTAIFGLLANGVPPLIGAMIIAPVTTPTMVLPHGVMQLSWPQIIRSAMTVLIGVAVVIMISIFSACVNK